MSRLQGVLSDSRALHRCRGVRPRTKHRTQTQRAHGERGCTGQRVVQTRNAEGLRFCGAQDARRRVVTTEPQGTARGPRGPWACTRGHVAPRGQPPLTPRRNRARVDGCHVLMSTQDVQ